MNDQTKGSVIALLGRGRTGKNSVGNYLMNRHDFMPLGITTPLYNALEDLIPDGRGLDDEEKDAVVAGHQKSGRELLQSLGDWARVALGNDVLRVHADATMRHAQRNGVARDFVVTDLRTPDEILWVWEKGGYVWHLQGAGALQVASHHTEEIETALIQAGERWRLMHPDQAHRHAIGADWLLSNTGTLEQLYEQVDTALSAIGMREFAQ
jgi:hypothetical protein